MTKYILHGGFTRVDNESNRAFFEEFVKDVPDNGNILLVYFASRTEEDLQASYTWHEKILRERFDYKNLNFIFATKENFPDELRLADAVFFNGGSTNKLLKVLKTYPDLKPLVQNKTLAGSSAGAYIMATLGASHSEETVREGLGFVPVRAVCHFESPKLPPSLASVETLKNTRQDLELVYLRDYEWKLFIY
jgi:peptidase E